MHHGFDGPAEELHFQGAAVERGYTVLTFDGPGPAAQLTRWAGFPLIRGRAFH